MKTTVNRAIFEQTTLDSGALTVLATALHRFDKPGDYPVWVYRGERRLGRVMVQVREDGPQFHVNIDLSEIDRPREDECGCKAEGDPVYKVRPGGMAGFFVSRGRGGYSVVIGQGGGESQRTRLDTRRSLEAGDMFAAAPLRPGAYSITDMLTGAQGTLYVAYPQGGRETEPPAQMRYGQAGFEPREMRIQAGQSLLIHLDTPAHIRVELQKPDDREGQPTRRGRIEWRKGDAPRGGKVE
jgi:hypothetical protein